MNSIAFTSLVATIAITGCSPTAAPPTNEVSGMVTLNGEPMGQVAVMFIPDRKVNGRTVESTGITDESGRYELIYSLPTTDSNNPLAGKGAVAGRHTVTVLDYKMVAESLPPPGRIPAIYTEKNSTPLSYEVKEGPQTIDIVLD